MLSPYVVTEKNPHTGPQYLPIEDFPSGRVVSSLDEMFEGAFSKHENLRVLPAPLRGDFNALAVRLAHVFEHPEKKISARTWIADFDGEDIKHKWRLLLSRRLPVGGMSALEKQAFDTLIDDFDKARLQHINLRGRLVYSFSCSRYDFHTDMGGDTFIRTYNHGGTRFILPRDVELIEGAQDLFKKREKAEEYQVPVGYYSFHAGKENQSPCIHESPFKKSGPIPRVLIIGQREYESA